MHDWNNPKAGELVKEVYSKYGAMIGFQNVILDVKQLEWQCSQSGIVVGAATVVDLTQAGLKVSNGDLLVQNFF